eukprot:TRINITY_DN2293_c1_g1_i1.p1 TRINITY_DN2293_c1_g1~~TRINITY_DN2293_c1_g1_i1.p1  ORF type:complete len:319 (+),score=109.99 TRINITY_DN2293_c1_g1_i1:68-1024(+)
MDPFLLSALVTIGMQLFFFAIAYTLKFDKVTDFAGSSNFILIAVLTLCYEGDYSTRGIVLTSIVCASRLELAMLLLYRVLKRGKDDRFDEIRENFFRFLFFWVFQMMWAFVVSLPVIFVNSDPAAGTDLNAWDYVGWSLFGLGLLAQVWADLDKMRFKNKKMGELCNIGLWAYSRHPNYFGEITMWVGAFICAVPVALESDREYRGWVTVLSPVFTCLILFFLSGLPTAEGKALARYYAGPTHGKVWEEYRAQTSPIIPLPPCCYRVLPLCLKRVVFCEFPFLEYKPEPNENSAADASAAPYGGTDVQPAYVQAPVTA